MKKQLWHWLMVKESQSTKKPTKGGPFKWKQFFSVCGERSEDNTRELVQKEWRSIGNWSKGYYCDTTATDLN